VCVLFAYFFGFLSFSVAVAESRWRYWCQPIKSD